MKQKVLGVSLKGDKFIYHFVQTDNVIALDSKGKELIKIFNKYNIEIYDITGNDINGNRQNEIKEWLNKHEVDSFIIIDDDSDDLCDFVNKELIKTSYSKDECGLCRKHVDMAVSALNEKVKRIF